MKLNVFHKADELVLLVYRYSRGFPADERFGLRAQLRRAALSIPTNIVEGSARNSRKDYLRFLDIALGSTAETDYLLHVATRLDYLPMPESEHCRTRALEVRKMLQKLIAALRGLSD
ncbi:MAG TPA: four helix bundle protein [Vicinamibacterales bacterium]